MLSFLDLKANLALLAEFLFCFLPYELVLHKCKKIQTLEQNFRKDVSKRLLETGYNLSNIQSNIQI